jgi:hypothetical protein
MSNVTRNCPILHRSFRAVVAGDLTEVEALSLFSVGYTAEGSAPKGQDLLSARHPARRALRFEYLIQCPEGAPGLSPGFQPWETPTPQRRALKGRKKTTINPTPFALKSGALTGRGAVGVRFPGLKPRAESCSPFGAKARPHRTALNRSQPWAVFSWPFGPLNPINS